MLVTRPMSYSELLDRGAALLGTLPVTSPGRENTFDLTCEPNQPTDLRAAYRDQ